jgi:hypothetical protein
VYSTVAGTPVIGAPLSFRDRVICDYKLLRLVSMAGMEVSCSRQLFAIEYRPALACRGSTVIGISLTSFNPNACF